MKNFADEFYRQLADQKPTPFYGYDLVLLRNTLKSALEAANLYGYSIHYAMKANVNLKIMEEIKNASLSVDCVSGGEILLALEYGFRPDQIVFAGVGKTDSEILLALENNIFCINVESLQELEVIEQIAKNLSKKAPIALRINPEIDAKTHSYITTGMADNKFGINIQDIPQALGFLKKSSHLNFLGLHFHIGSLISDKKVFHDLCIKVNEIIKEIEEWGLIIEVLNMGGGLGIDYHQPNKHPIPDFEGYFKIFNTHLKLDSSIKVHFELGRSMVGQCGTLVTKVLYEKRGGSTQFLVVDAGMNNLMRPALYNAYHHIDPLKNMEENTPKKTYSIVGPICETSDFIRNSIELPVLFRGDILAIRSVGAYGEVMSSNYNLRPKAEVFYFDEGL